MNKSVLTNLIAALFCIGGFFSPIHRELITMTGLFALSGGVTNWLAIHMLFERVPFLYGSGVIPNHFEDFKKGIKTLIVTQFFTPEHIQRFFEETKSSTSNSIIDKVDFDEVFAGLLDTIASSKLGGMLTMIGGTQALEPLRKPIITKLKTIITSFSKQSSSEDGEEDFTKSLITKITIVIDSRLNELTPTEVKNIVQNMIRQHLGWLVVWGGVFGGLIGLIVNIILI